MHIAGFCRCCQSVLLQVKLVLGAPSWALGRTTSCLRMGCLACCVWSSTRSAILGVLSARRAENSSDGPRVGARPSKIPPSLPVSSIPMGFSGASHLNSFQGSWVAIHPGWVGTGTTLSDRGLGIKSSVFTSQDLAGKGTQIVLEILCLTATQSLAGHRILTPCLALVRLSY